VTTERNPLSASTRSGYCDVMVEAEPPSGIPMANKQGRAEPRRNGAEAARDDAEDAAATAESTPALRILARTGYAVLGLVHILIGGFAISAATNAGGGEADQSGAMSQISRTGGGPLLLWTMAIGLLALTLWQVAQVLLVRADSRTKTWAKRSSEAGKGVAYGVLGVSALVFALGGRQSSHRTTQGFSAWLLATPGGAVVVAIIGLTVVAIGVGFAVMGTRRSFRKQLRMPARALRVAVEVVGVVGYWAKGVALVIVGALFVVSAFTRDSHSAGGLDSAVKALDRLPFGDALLWVVGLGLIVYGVYCGVRALLAKL
jgi:hypothetical protein